MDPARIAQGSRRGGGKTSTGAQKKLSLHPSESLSSNTEAPCREDFHPAYPLALEGGLVIRLHRHGAHVTNRQSNLSDEPLCAGFFSRAGHASLVKKDLEACEFTSAEDAITRGDYNALPLTTGALSGHHKVNNHGDVAERLGFVSEQPQCADEANATQLSTLSSTFGIERLANSESDHSNFAATRENGIRKAICKPDNSSVDKDLQKVTVVVLKQMLLEHGLPLTGNKSTLIRRLEEVLCSAKQAGQPSTVKNVDMESLVHRQSHEQATCAPQTRSLKRTSDDQEHEQLRKDICSTGTGRSPKTARRYSLRSKRCPSAERYETEDGNASGPASVNTTPATPGEVRKVTMVKASSKRIKISEPFQEPSWGDPKMFRKAIKITDPLEENSWGNLQVLRKGASSQSGRSQKPIRPSQRPTLRPGERDNFVRLNINGKGRGRKFVNGTRTKRPGAYGRRGTQGAKYRKKGKTDIANGGSKGNEVRQDGDCEPARNCAGNRANSLWANDGWLETNSSPAGLVDSSSTEELNARLKEVIEKAQKTPSDKNILDLLHAVFGFKTFRPGQLEAVKRVLSLQSTLVTLPTGAGKSLCYQLPAHLLPGITLVISPLIALMTDQLGHLPPSLPGALISSAQTPQESSHTISRLRAGQVKVLFISPERLFSESFLCTLGELPKISLAVVDEAHCLSEWSHNFRPSYLKLGKVLHQRMQVSCVLAMTATATKKAEQSIVKSLCIPDGGIVQTSHMGQNLSMSVSREEKRLHSLLSLLQSSPYKEAKSIIIYCTFQLETDNISGFLERNGIQAKSYHAKKTSQERSRVYDLFCRNKLRVVVATVAFGMGLDKSDVRAIIHYNMPSSLEHYVQETGRAGRDGNPAHCHLFLDDGDYLKLRSLAFSDGVDEYSVNNFLRRVFNECSASTTSADLGSIIIDTASRQLDMKEEVMETILLLLEVGEVEYVKVLSKLNATCTLSFHQSNPASLAGRNDLVAAVMKRSKETQGRHVFHIPSIATQLQWSLFQVQSELRKLQAAGEIAYEVGDSAFCFTVLRIPEDICLLTSQITKRLTEVEQCQVRKLDATYMAASAAVLNSNWVEPQENNTAISVQQASLQSCIRSYFEGEEDLPASKNVSIAIQSDRSFVRADIKVFLSTARTPLMTGRAVARIFHGLWSPAFPYSDWSKSHFWGLHAKIEFEIIKEAAAAEILLQHTTNRGDFEL